MFISFEHCARKKYKYISCKSIIRLLICTHILSGHFNQLNIFLSSNSKLQSQHINWCPKRRTFRTVNIMHLFLCQTPILKHFILLFSVNIISASVFNIAVLKAELFLLVHLMSHIFVTAMTIF